VNRNALIAIVVLIVVALLAYGYVSRHNEVVRMEQNHG
jgi:hypothetical protein